MECEERLVRVREARNAAIDKWKTARSAVLESIDSLDATVCYWRTYFIIITYLFLLQVDLSIKKDLHKFKVPPLLPTMTIRQLVAEPPGIF